MISPIRKKLGFLKKNVGFFQNLIFFFKIGKGSEFAPECVPNDLSSLKRLLHLTCEVCLQKKFRKYEVFLKKKRYHPFKSWKAENMPLIAGHLVSRSMITQCNDGEKKSQGFPSRISGRNIQKYYQDLARSRKIIQEAKNPKGITRVLTTHLSYRRNML